MIDSSNRIDIPKGYARYAFSKITNSDGETKFIFSVGRSDRKANPGTKVNPKEESIEDICSFEVNRAVLTAMIKDCLDVIECLNVMKWMEANGYAEQEGDGAGTDLAEKQNG